MTLMLVSNLVVEPASLHTLPRGGGLCDQLFISGP